MRRNGLAARLFLLCAFVTLPLLFAGRAQADQSVIKYPGDHPDYRFEAEPHALIGFGGPFRGGKAELGAGFRGTVIFLDNGFIKTINNSVGVTFGADVFTGRGTVLFPVAMQWNFWLSTHWSVFFEPGVVAAINRAPGRDPLHLAVWAGGRYHFNDRIALTMRLGYPAFGLGVSFLL